MQKRIIPVGMYGMNQDSMSPKVNQQQAYELKNFRINANENGNIELTSERGTVEANIVDTNEDPVDFSGIKSICGYCVFGDKIVLFIDDGYSRIGLLEPHGQLPDFTYRDLYVGDLGFDAEYRIEAIPYYESEDVQKVYWIDGSNYPRVINIMHDYSDGNGDYPEEDPFCFYQKVSPGRNYISVTKKYSGGLFHAGVIQYAFSFYNKNAQETPIVFTTPLNYISHEDKGEQPNKQLGCEFELTLYISDQNHDKFEYIRVYSIYRSSLDGTPVVKVINDIKTSMLQRANNVYSVKFTDTNTTGYNFDAFRILIQNDHIVPQAMAHKDEKLFMANYESKKSGYIWDLFLNNGLVNWDREKTIPINNDPTSSVYPNRTQIRNHNSDDMKIFKQGEYYMLGLQFQDEYGDWSEPYVVCTSQNNCGITNDGYEAEIPIPIYNYTPSQIKTILRQHSQLPNYVNVRPVISFPTLSERSILCQCVASKTVFNYGQRKNGTCYAQSSWFFRPQLPSQYVDSNVKGLGIPQGISGKPLYSSDDFRSEIQCMYFDSVIEDPYESLSNFIDGTQDYPPFGDRNVEKLDNAYTPSNIPYTYTYTHQTKDNNIYLRVSDSSGTTTIDGITYNTVDVRCLLGSSDLPYKTYYYYAGESGSLRPKKNYNEIDQSDGIKYDHCYFVEKNVQTLNSPDLEFDDRLLNVDISKYNKLYKRGCVLFKNGSGRYRIVSQPPLFLNSEPEQNTADNNRFIRSTTMATGSYERTQSYFNESSKSGRMLLSRTMWFDDVCNIFTWEDSGRQRVFGWNRRKSEIPYMVYPWQRQWLNNYSANKFLVGNTELHDDKCQVTNEAEPGKIIRKVLSNIRYCVTQYDSYEESNTNFDKLKIYNSDEATLLKLDNDKYYYGNVDQMVVCTSNYRGWKYSHTASQDMHSWRIDEVGGYPIMVRKEQYSHDLPSGSSEGTLFPTIERPGQNGWDLTNGDHAVQLGDLPYGLLYYNAKTSETPTPNVSSTDPIAIRYKSARHAVVTFDDRQETQEQGIQDPYLYIYDIARDISNEPYANPTEFDVTKRIWVPAGETYSLEEYLNNIKWTEGDTYLQRYDCLKTYPFSNDDYQSVVEIGSFLLETRINLEGRYDDNIGLLDNTFVNPSNFNLINNVYSQGNNFFQYNIYDTDDNRDSQFKNRITWSLNKINGQDIDEWTRTNTSAFLDLDGDKGQITSLRRYNDQIFAFQEKGIAHVKYNENVAINASNGLPIELGNSQSVNGKDYVSETVGSQNKWSCISTPNGIFFVDNNTQGIYQLAYGQGVQLKSLTKDVLQRWFETENAGQLRFIKSASYDRNMDEVQFMFDNGNKEEEEESIAYQCRYGIFSSFYDYNGWIDNVGKYSFNISGNKLHILRNGSSYSNFYGVAKDSWMTFVANPQVDGMTPFDCIYDNVWYTADVLGTTNSENMNNGELIDSRYETGSDWGTTFNTITVGNDYQYAKSTSGFRKKFRMWRVPIPRQDRARMRNSWLKIKLGASTQSKMVIKNIYVDAFY